MRHPPRPALPGSGRLSALTLTRLRTHLPAPLRRPEREGRGALINVPECKHSASAPRKRSRCVTLANRLRKRQGRVLAQGRSMNAGNLVGLCDDFSHRRRHSAVGLS